MNLKPGAVAAIRKAIVGAKGLAVLVLLEQFAEVALLGVSLAEHPWVVLACLGAFGFPLPGERG